MLRVKVITKHPDTQVYKVHEYDPRGGAVDAISAVKTLHPTWDTIEVTIGRDPLPFIKEERS